MRSQGAGRGECRGAEEGGQRWREADGCWWWLVAESVLPEYVAYGSGRNQAT